MRSVHGGEGNLLRFDIRLVFSRDIMAVANVFGLLRIVNFIRRGSLIARVTT